MRPNYSESRSPCPTMIINMQIYNLSCIAQIVVLPIPSKMSVNNGILIFINKNQTILFILKKLLFWIFYLSWNAVKW